MAVEFVDNSTQVKAQLDKNIGKALESIGLHWQTRATEEANKQIYDTPESPAYERTTRYRKGMGYKPELQNKQVIVGNNVEYSPYIEFGTARMKSRPIIKDSIMNYKDDYQEIVSKTLGEGFGK